MQNKRSNKNLYIFGAVFSIFMFFGLFGEIFKSLDNLWLNLRFNLPYEVSNLITGTGDYKFSWGKFINKPADPRISIAAIDTYTVKKYGFPFKRRYYADLFKNLNKLGAKAIGVDVMFFEPDRDSPANDAALVEGTRKSGNVVNLVEINLQTKKLSSPIKGLMEASRYMAYPNSDIGLDEDGYVRKFYPFYPSTKKENVTYSELGSRKLRCLKDGCGEVRLCALSVATFAIYSGKALKSLSFNWVEEALEEYPVFPLYINFRHPQHRLAHPGWRNPPGDEITSTYRHISVADIISGSLSKEEKAAIKGGMILVGSTALGTYDHFPAPFSQQYPGVEVHANVIDNLLHEDSLTTISNNMEFLSVIFFLTMVLIWIPIVLYRFSSTAIALVSAGVFGFLLVLDTALYYRQISLPLSTIMVAFIVPFVYVVVYKAMTEGQEKKWIKNTFGQYLSPKVVELVTKDPSKLGLGGEKRDMTAFFLDIAGFTTMSEKLAPEELTAMLTNYLSGLTDIILKHDGTVDKYIGDCIMAFWNAPLDQAEHRKLAILAAVDCQAEMTRLNESLTQYEIKPSCRVGVNSGPMVVGNMGSKTRLSYTIMGDSVNLASRLEGANKFFHSKIMTSEYTFEDIREQFDYRFLGSIRVVGKAIPVKVYEPFARKGEAPADVQAMLKNYAAGIEKFYKGDYAGSVPDFKAALEARPGDGPSQYYIETAEAYAKAPPKDWDQAFNLTSKG